MKKIFWIFEKALHYTLLYNTEMIYYTEFSYLYTALPPLQLHYSLIAHWPLPSNTTREKNTTTEVTTKYRKHPSIFSQLSVHIQNPNYTSTILTVMYTTGYNRYKMYNHIQASHIVEKWLKPVHDIKTRKNCTTTYPEFKPMALQTTTMCITLILLPPLKYIHL